MGTMGPVSTVLMYSFVNSSCVGFQKDECMNCFVLGVVFLLSFSSLSQQRYKSWKA